MAKDPFGFGMEVGMDREEFKERYNPPEKFMNKYFGEQPQEEPQMTEETMMQISEAAKQIMMQGEPIPDDLRETIMSIPDTQEESMMFNEIGALKTIASNNMELQDDGNWIFGDQQLEAGQTPEMFFLSTYPPIEEQEAKGQMDTGQANVFGY